MAYALVVSVAITTAPVALTSARADTSVQASIKVQAILTRVHGLARQSAAAEKQYQTALNNVADSVDVAITDDQTSTAMTERAVAAHATLISQVLGLYESGGSLESDASILTSGNVAQAYARQVLASSAVRSQVANVHAAATAATAAQKAETVASRTQFQKVATARTVEDAASQFETLLGQQRQLLKQADKHLKAVQAAEAEVAAQASEFSAITTQSVAGLHILPPSAQYLTLYQSAALTCPNLSWTVLAAIGQVETGHGRNTNTSSAGAQGPMQFEPATFAAYAVDGDHDGTVSIDDPADAIYTAAHYLCANGAGAGPGGLRGAILHYNHAVWYLDLVLTLSKMYATTYG